MIAHAWTTICDRTAVDRGGESLTLETLEVLHVDKRDDGEPALVPCQLEIVSLWYRRDPSQGGLHRVHVCVLSPQLEALACFPVDVDLRTAPRARTRCVLDVLLVRRPGTYYVAVDVLETTPAREVARVPLQVALAA